LQPKIVLNRTWQTATLKSVDSNASEKDYVVNCCKMCASLFLKFVAVQQLFQITECSSTMFVTILPRKSLFQFAFVASFFFTRRWKKFCVHVSFIWSYDKKLLFVWSAKLCVLSIRNFTAVQRRSVFRPV